MIRLRELSMACQYRLLAMILYLPSSVPSDQQSFPRYRRTCRRNSSWPTRGAQCSRRARELRRGRRHAATSRKPRAFCLDGSCRQGCCSTWSRDLHRDRVNLDECGGTAQWRSPGPFCRRVLTTTGRLRPDRPLCACAPSSNTGMN